MKRRSATRGFTLVELLVATAIFALLMSAIAALFVASLHAVRAGYQSQGAYETARGTFNVVERDLTTAFTARDFGQYYQFYGNEYGMTMVGMLHLRDSSGQEYSKLGRVTYVIYPVVIRDRAGKFFVTQPFFLKYAKDIGAQDAGFSNVGLFQAAPVKRLVAGDGGPSDTESICTAALIRYVEPGVTDLDSFPFDWEELMQYTDSPEFPATGSNQTIREQLDVSLDVDGTGNDFSNNVPAKLEDRREQMLAAKRRDLWIKMLSCQQYWIPKVVNGTPILPNPWGLRNYNTNAISDPCWLNGVAGDQTLVVDPRDYVIADNVGVETRVNMPFYFPLRPYTPDKRAVVDLYTEAAPPAKPYFEYGRVAPDATPEFMLTWNDNRLGTIDTTNTLATNGIDDDGDGVTDEPDERVIRPVIKQNNISDNILPASGVVNNNQAYGSPLRARLPEAVMLRLPLVYPSAYFGAPHFVRKFEQLVDVPTAFTRSQLAVAAP